MKKIILCLQLLLITSVTFANAIDLFTPNDYVIDAAQIGESMNDEEFMFFAFAFSEIPENKIPLYMQDYRALATKLSDDVSRLNLSNYDTAEYILTFLHSNLFKTYREPITKLNNLFDSGVYNCVSSSIVYFALAMRFNITVSGVKTHDHAFCSVNIAGTSTDVETTSPYGFNPGEKREFENSFGQTGFIYTPPSNYRDRTNIGKLAMLSLIIQNNIVELYKTQRFDTIVVLAVNIDALLQTKGSREAMIREFGNYAAYLSKRKEYAQGIVFISSAAKHFNAASELEEIAGSLFNNGIASLLSYRSIHQLSQNIQKAQDFYTTYKDVSIIPRDVVSETKKILDEASIRTFVEGKTLQTSVSEVKKYYTETRISKKIYQDLIMYVYSKEIKNLLNDKNWGEALAIAQRAIIDSENDSRSNTQLQQVEYNIGAHYHNRFATLYNNQDFLEATKILNEGLKIVPNHKTLLSDKKLIQELY